MRRAGVAGGALALAALLVALGRARALEHGDSIVPILVSLQRWTPFYWDQERYGMLVPLLALPLRDPLANLLAQRFLLALAGLGAVVLVAAYASRGRTGALAGAAAAAALLALAPEEWRFEYLASQPYGLSLALGAAGLLAADGGPGARRPLRLGAAAFLVVAAHWVNAAAGLFLLPLAAARAVAATPDDGVRPALRSGALACGLVVLGLAAGQGMLRLYPVLTGKPLRLAMGFLPAAEWPAAWRTLAENAWFEGAAWGVALALVAGLGLALLAPAEARAARPGALRRAGALAAAALAYALAVGPMRWVADNAFHPRYLAPAAVLVHVAAWSLLAEGLAVRARLVRPARAIAAALVPLAALAVSGAPSPARARADLDAALGRHTADVRAAGCALVSGSYWSVWPAVYHGLLVAHARGEPARLWGVCHRANPTVPRWRDRPRATLRICVPEGELRDAERWLRAFHLWPAREVARQGSVVVLAPGGE